MYPISEQLESDRLNEFVREAWVDQKQWRLDEAKRRERSEARIAEEGKEMQRQEEAKERRLQEEREAKRLQCQAELQEQIQRIK